MKTEDENHTNDKKSISWIPKRWRRKKSPFISQFEARYNDTFSKIGKWKLSGKSEFKKQALIQQITEDANEFREIGETDGWRGLNPDSMRKISTNIARLWKSYIQSSFHQKKIIAVGRQADVTVRYEHLVNWLKSLQNHRAVIDTHYKYHSKHYSLFFGLIYLVAAACLIYADFPLAKQVVQEGFQISNPKDAKWIAIGLMMMTAYIKIVYDDYLGNSIQKTLLNQRADNLLGEGFKASDSELKKASKIRSLQLFSKLFVLTLLIITIVSLGLFRHNFIEAGASQVIGNIYGDVISSNIAKWSFVLISIMFPIVGGICASVGFRNIRNVLDRKLINLRIWRIQRKKQYVLEKRLIADGIVKECDENLTWVNQEGENGFILECKAYFFSCYMHGYNRGVNLAMPKDYYDVAEYARNRTLMHHTADHLANRAIIEEGRAILSNFHEPQSPTKN